MRFVELTAAAFLLVAGSIAPAQERIKLDAPPTFTVGGRHAPDGFTANFGSIQDAVTAAPAEGAIIRIRPGTYREVVHIDKPGIQLRGDGKDASQVVIVFANSAANTCGTLCSATMFVTGDDFYAEGLTIANDSGKTGKPRTQAVALSMTGDRAVLRNVRLLGEQDTLMAGSKSCPGCAASRQYFESCYIEGEVDFIFGNAKAYFEGCEIRSVAHGPGGFVTAQNRLAGEDSGYVFDRCRLTANEGAGKVHLGRPWRDYATVTFLRTDMGAHIQLEGRSEWHPSETDHLKIPTYAEFASTGPGAAGKRERYVKQLTEEEAKGYEAATFLEGSDHWNPAKVH